MVTTLAPDPTLFFTFRATSNADGEMAVEAVAEELAEQDRSVAPDAYKRYWSGSEREFATILAELGFSMLDQQGVLASLHSHRDAARKLDVSQALVEEAGFVELARA